MSTNSKIKTRQAAVGTRLRASAPGRVNLIGEHVDYCQGWVMPMAIDRRVTLEAVIQPTESLLLHSGEMSSANIDLKTGLREPAEPAWANYVRGVAAGFAEMGYELPGMEIDIHSTVPLGGGLSSSAALEVAAATLLEGSLGIELDFKQKALLCQQAEHRFARVPCGIMDQSASVFGRADHAMLLDCRSLELLHVPMSDPSVSVLIFNTMVKHELGSGEYAKRRQSCEEAARILQVESLRDVTIERLEKDWGRLPYTERRRARHVVSEMKRVPAFAEAVRNGEWATAGTWMKASHQSLREDFEVSSPELDFIADLANARHDVYGCRMTGGGFGGCCVALVKTDQASTIQRELRDNYRQRFGIDAESFVTRPEQGPSCEPIKETF